MEQFKEASICLQIGCHKLPIFSLLDKTGSHDLHLTQCVDQIQIDQLVQQNLFEITHEEILTCYTKLYQFDKIKQEMGFEIVDLKDQLDEKYIDHYLPLFKQGFKPLRILQQNSNYNLDEALAIKGVLGIDENLDKELEIVIEQQFDFQIIKNNQDFNQQIEEAFESLQYKLQVLKYKQDELIDQLLQMNTQIGDVTLKEEALEELKKGRKRRRQKQSNYEIEKIITTLQVCQDQILNPNEEKSDIQDQEIPEPQEGEQVQKSDDLQNNDIQQVVTNIDPSKIVFTGRNRFFIRRTQQEKINIVCEAIKSPNIQNITEKYLVCADSIIAWKQKYLNKCLDILESNNVFFIRRPGWCRENQGPKQQKQPKDKDAETLK